MGHSPATENRHKINKDDYKGMFLLAKIGVIAVHCLLILMPLIKNTPCSIQRNGR